MQRRISAIALVAALWAMLLLPGTAAAYTKYGAWAPSAPGALKSYTFDVSSTRCASGYRLRIEFELGTVTTTTAYIRTVRFWYSRFNNISWTGQGTPYTSIKDDFGHVASADDNRDYPPSFLWTWNVARTFTFNQDRGILLDRFDESYSPAGCLAYFQFEILANAA